MRTSRFTTLPDRGVLVLLGVAGSGKGTMGRHLLEDGVTVAHVSMGEMLRGVIRLAQEQPEAREGLEDALGGDAPVDWAGSKLEWLEHCEQHGLLVPNAWTQSIIEHQLEHRDLLRHGRWSLDGYPRRIGAAEHLLGTLERFEIPVWRVISLEISEAEALRRLLARGRADDTPEAIHERFRVYQESVLPTLEFLKSQLGERLVLRVNAEAPEPDWPVSDAVSLVYQRVLTALGLGRR